MENLPIVRGAATSVRAACPRARTVRPLGVVLLALLCAALAAACSDERADGAAEGRASVDDDGSREASQHVSEGVDLPPRARPDIVASLRAGRDAPRHPSDGGGHAVRELAEGESAVATAGGPVRVSLLYTAGPLGIAVGGTLFLQVPPFWDWSEPWVDPDGEAPADMLARRPGYTVISCAAEGVRVRPEVVDQQLLAISIDGRALGEGEQVRVVYGAGDAVARADRYAEHGSPFWFWVDGDGDGARSLVPDPPRVDVVAGDPAQLVLTLPSSVSAGQEARLTLAVLDAVGNAGPPFTGEVELVDPETSLGLPATIAFDAGDEARRTIAFTPSGEGVFRVFARAGALEAISNPMQVQERALPILWADLQGHGALSDGTGTIEDFYGYARDVAALDVVALTEHDHWGLPFLDEQADAWADLQRRVAAFDDPGHFLALVGYEWTNWIFGHRHVVSFEDDRPLELLSSIDEAHDTPSELWDALRGRKLLTFAHHSAGGPVAIDWTDFPPDAQLEPVTEIVSVHGSSEALDGPHVIHRPLPGNFVRDALLGGARLGFIGSGDSHDGHPGLSHLASPTGASGLCALLTGDLGRDGVYTALRERRTYATTGARILVRASLDGRRMGETVAPRAGTSTLVVIVHGTHLVDRIEIVRGAEVVDVADLTDEPVLDVIHTVTLADLRAGEFVYARIVQADGHAAWTSPFFVEVE